MECIVLFLLLVAAGCTRPSFEQVSPTPPAVITTIHPEPEKPEVTAERTVAGKILITYKGGPDADKLLELETTIITGSGSVYIRSMGSRLDTTPVRIGGTDVFPGSFTGQVHVLTTAYYTNGTHREVLDTTV